MKFLKVTNCFSWFCLYTALCVCSVLQSFVNVLFLYASCVCVSVFYRCGLSAIEISLKEDSSTTKRHLVG